MSGISMPALNLRQRRGALPEPAGHGPRGWPYWAVPAIQRWLDASTSPACPICQTRVDRLDSHLLLRHHVLQPEPQSN